jgi:hypothetical protein
MKSTLSRLGIRGFKPTLRKADEKLSELRTPKERFCLKIRVLSFVAT